MTQLFLQLAQSVTGNVVTIVALEIASAIIGFIIAWFYAKSVYTPVIKSLEADKNDLNSQVATLKEDFGNLDRKVTDLNEKIGGLEKELAAKESELKDLSAETGPIGKYAVSKAKNGEVYFNLKATNGQVILTSSMYPTMDDCNRWIETARENCENDSMFDRKTSSNNKNFFNLITPDGQIIGKSELYESHTNMEKGIASVKRNGISTIVVEE